MGVIKNINADLIFLSERFLINKLAAVLFNRGMHALISYRFANYLYKIGIPIIPFLLTRIIQILYSIDISWKCNIDGGIIIIHGVGLVIGEGSSISKGCIIYHGVTLGRKYQIPEQHPNDGFPQIGENCVLGAGAKLIGNINIGECSVISPNVVLVSSISKMSFVKNPSPIIFKKNNEV